MPPKLNLERGFWLQKSGFLCCPYSWTPSIKEKLTLIITVRFGRQVLGAREEYESFIILAFPAVTTQQVLDGEEGTNQLRSDYGNFSSSAKVEGNVLDPGDQVPPL